MVPGTPGAAQRLGGGRRRRSGVKRKREGPQHRREAVLQVRDRAVEQEIGIACPQGPGEAAADEEAVEDERGAHEALDMA
jgi:hypothetical protein